MSNLTERSALISVFNKDGIEKIARKLVDFKIKIISTGGTEKYLNSRGIKTEKVENLTNYPSIFGGRVKTLHPKIFGGILHRRELDDDIHERNKFKIPSIDFVIVDLYPFEETVNNVKSHEEIIEKIDIGGISLIRAAAKNYNDLVCVSSINQYNQFLIDLEQNQGNFPLSKKKEYAMNSFKVSSNYDTQIHRYLMKGNVNNKYKLRYGENPHQEGYFEGNFDEIFKKISGKDLSYNNLLDIDSAYNLILEFWNEKPTFAILKHNNACGVATRDNIKDAYLDALAGDPVSAFGGILITNSKINNETACDIKDLFCEVVMAPEFDDDAINILKEKKNRIILKLKRKKFNNKSARTCLNGVLIQDRDSITDSIDKLKYVTISKPNVTELSDLIFASKICKHTKSNTIVLSKNLQLLASGTGQTSRVDALNQAIEKAKRFNFNLDGAVMASDAFFPFPDCVEIASKSGIKSVIQPGGSIKDDLSIEFCNNNNMSMVMTGIRHFKH